MKIKIISSKGQVGYYIGNMSIPSCIADNEVDIYFNYKYREEDIHYDVDNPFYILEWSFENKDIVILLTGISNRQIIDPTSNLLVVLTKNMTIVRDNKAIHICLNREEHWGGYVINSDGSINHQIKVPKYIYTHNSSLSETYLPKNKFEEMMVKNKYPVEGLGYIHFDEKRDSLVIGLDFAREWYQERLYNTETQEWGEIVRVARY